MTGYMGFLLSIFYLQNFLIDPVFWQIIFFSTAFAIAEEVLEMPYITFQGTLTLLMITLKHFQIGDWQTLAQKNYRDALNDYTKAIELDSKKSGAYASRGALFIILEDYINAKKDLKMAIKLDPKNVNAINSIAVMFARLEEFAKPFDELSRAVIIDSTYAETYRNMTKGLSI